MSQLKNNLSEIYEHSERIAKGYVNLFVIKFAEKFALILGILGTLFLLSILLLLIIIFASFSLAAFLNQQLGSEYLGFVITAFAYMLIITLAVIKIMRSGTPLFTNFFIKIILPVLNIDIEFSKNRKGLKHQTDKIEQQISATTDNLKSDVKLLRYSLWETLITEIIGLFKFRKEPRSKASERKPGHE